MSEGTVEMSRISLRLRVGEQGGTLTHDAPLRDPSSTLAVFLEGTLRDLESRGLIKLSVLDEVNFIDPHSFKVFDEQMTQELDLSVAMCDQPGVVSGMTTGAPPPVIILQSHLFTFEPGQLQQDKKSDGASSCTASYSSPDHDGGGGGVVSRYHSKKRKVSSSRRRQSKVPSLEGLDISRPPAPGKTEDNEGGRSKSVPNTPVGMENPELDALAYPSVRFSSDPEVTPLRFPGAKVAVSATYSLPLAVIEEPGEVGGANGEEEEEKGGGSEGTQEHRRMRLNRSPSPALNVPPSPIRGPSPSSSPRNTRKTRIAKRRSRFEGGGGGSGGGGERGGPGGSLDPQESSRETFIRLRNRTIRDSSRRSAAVSAYFPAKIFTTIQTFPITFDIPVADLAVELIIQGDQTVGQIKDCLWSVLREEGVEEEDGVLTDPEKFTFTYKLRDETYELYDEQQIFQTAAVVQVWRREKVERGLITVEQKKAETKEEKTLNMEIGAMIGIGLYQLQFANNDELDITRRKMVAVRRHAVWSRDAMQYSMETDTTFQDIPSSILDSLVEQRVLLRVYYKTGSYMTFQAEVYEIADNLLGQFIPEAPAKRERLGLPQDINLDDYVLKVSGEESYIYGHYELIKFSHIIQCISKKMDIVLALVRKKNIEEDQCREVADWNLIDSSTGLTGTHSELSALSKEHTQVFTMSMWDLNRRFRVRIVGLDNFQHSDIDVVYLEAGVYHGGQVLGGTRWTTESLPSGHPRWNQWLSFDMPVKMLPKAARLCLHVVGGVRSRDSRKRNTKGFMRSMSKADDKKSEQSDRPLHWVNMQILDHRALLRQGLLRLNLWPVVTGDGTTNSAPSPMGSTAVNPDGNTSVALYIELDTYMHPVACPTGGWGDEMTFQPESTPRKKMKEELDSVIHADPLTTLSRAEKELVWSCRSYCSKFAVALPKLLQSVDWANLSQVCEVHRLLEVWAPITLDVALELLDYHFADERVRALAVHQLEKLTNEELRLYLLQLTQVLKFEPYHDSALARLLLKRALQSKKIGHFFYWYLRSEMDTPEFNQRYSILLEAYLRGCGESMFKELQRQHKAVCDIMSVASSLKRYMEKNKGVVEFARAELAKYQLPETFCPPFNPIMKMGGLKLEKVKVMDSKKSPLWLEFENKDPTAVEGKLIKVIAKHGDDLRQDMLTLQMLSLMDKLWQSQGLDLYIISYGCIATGNMMGMIEVVQEADTVAKIQQKHGGSFSAFKEEPLHDWLRQHNLTKNRWDATVERFMLSCAGYCVATYILGIGDRHNDNIMVTTSGNLFHIDFGHFLGNQKKFMGVNRERAPFVLTPDFEYVMGKRGSDLFKKFEETALKAYMVIRRNANLFINLFSMMKCTGIPELRSVEDIEYLRGVLYLGRGEEEAKEHFKSQIQSCLKLAWRTQLNFLVHNYAHRS